MGRVGGGMHRCTTSQLPEAPGEHHKLCSGFVGSARSREDRVKEVGEGRRKARESQHQDCMC